MRGLDAKMARLFSDLFFEHQSIFLKTPLPLTKQMDFGNSFEALAKLAKTYHCIENEESLRRNLGRIYLHLIHSYINTISPDNSKALEQVRESQASMTNSQRSSRDFLHQLQKKRLIFYTTKLRS